MNMEIKSISQESWDEIFSNEESYEFILDKTGYIYFDSYYEGNPEESISGLNEIFDFFMNPENKNKEWIKISNNFTEEFFLIEKSEYEEIKDILNLSFI